MDLSLYISLFAHSSKHSGKNSKSCSRRPSPSSITSKPSAPLLKNLISIYFAPISRQFSKNCAHHILKFKSTFSIGISEG